MWIENIFGLTICIIGFMYLKQITTWTLPSFRQGIVVYKYSESFIGNIPKELTNREIAFNNIIFKFISPKTGLFKAHPPMSFFKDVIRNYFPSLLGEIELSGKGIAQVTLRIPLPTILISLTLFIGWALSNIEGPFKLDSFFLRFPDGAFVTIILIAIFIFNFLREKKHLHEGFIMLKESANAGTLG